MPYTTKDLAERIAKKLNAQIEERSNRPHDLAHVFHEGKRLVSFGIRRGSRKDLGHDHIPRELRISPHEARLLGQCPLSKNEWIEILKRKGLA